MAPIPDNQSLPSLCAAQGDYVDGLQEIQLAFMVHPLDILRGEETEPVMCLVQGIEQVGGERVNLAQQDDVFHTREAFANKRTARTRHLVNDSYRPHIMSTVDFASVSGSIPLSTVVQSVSEEALF